MLATPSQPSMYTGYEDGVVLLFALFRRARIGPSFVSAFGVAVGLYEAGSEMTRCHGRHDYAEEKPHAMEDGQPRAIHWAISRDISVGAG